MQAGPVTERNVDALRERFEGPRHDAQGNRLPTPMRCMLCPEDAVYHRTGHWFCGGCWLNGKVDTGC